jgi:hypothetical protein
MARATSVRTSTTPSRGAMVARCGASLLSHLQQGAWRRGQDRVKAGRALLSRHDLGHGPAASTLLLGPWLQQRRQDPQLVRQQQLGPGCSSAPEQRDVPRLQPQLLCAALPPALHHLLVRVELKHLLVVAVLVLVA